VINPEQIKTIDGFTEFRLKEKGSLFISLAYFAEKLKSDLLTDRGKTDEILTKLRNQYYDATHHCYAYKFRDGSVKYSDDGEPSGTAGVRILKAIEHFELTDIIVVIIRYFGGTKLGTGPLGKAYYDSAYEALFRATIIKKNAFRLIKISYSEEFTNPVYRVLGQFGVKIRESGYEERNFVSGHIKENEMTSFQEALKNLTKGGVTFEILGEIEYLAV